MSTEASILLIGDAGSKKTTFCGQAEAFIYDFDAGTAVLGREYPHYQTFKDMPFGQKVLQTFKDRGFYQWGKAWPAFVKHLNDTVGAAIDRDEWGNRPIAFDSITLMMNLAMNHVLAENNRKPTDGIRIQDWGQQIGLVETVIDQLTAWPVTFIATAHIHRDTNEMMQTVEYLPLLPGKFAGRVPVYFDEVWYTNVSGKGNDRKYSLITESTGMYKQAKTRHNVPDGSPLDWAKVRGKLEG